jgi:hypothetical protein
MSREPRKHMPPVRPQLLEDTEETEEWERDKAGREAARQSSEDKAETAKWEAAKESREDPDREP